MAEILWLNAFKNQKTNKQKEKQCGLTNRQITDFHEYYLKRIHVNPEYREKKS